MSLEAGLFSTAAEIMSSPPITATPDTTVQEAVVLLEEKRISGIPVVDTDQRLLGMLTEFDLLLAIRNHHFQDSITKFMSTDIVSVQDTDTLADLTDLILEKRIRRVPVIHDGQVVGVISRRDLVFVAHVRRQLLTELPVASFSRHENLPQ